MTTLTCTTAARAVARTPEQLHALFAACATAGDVDGLVSLFEPDAVMRQAPGADARGPVALREACAGLAALDARFEITTDAVCVAGDLALCSATWTATTSDGTTLGGRTTEVARLQPDGRWLTVVDAPTWIA